MAKRAWRRVTPREDKRRYFCMKMTLMVQENMEASSQAGDQNSREATTAISAGGVHHANKTTGGGDKRKEHIAEE